MFIALPGHKIAVSPHGTCGPLSPWSLRFAGKVTAPQRDGGMGDPPRQY